jgi:hypothetical protein
MSRLSIGPSRVSALAAFLIAVIAGVHLQQYIDFISEVPTVGVLFVLNAAGGAGLAVALLSSDRELRLLAAVGGIGLAIASLISIMIALSGNFFGFSEPTLRFPILLAIIAEIAVLPVLVALIIGERRSTSAAAPADAPASV